MRKQLFVLCLLLLAACAPTIRGSSAREPMIVESAQQVVMEQGTETFLRIDYALEDFGLKPTDLSGAFWIPEGLDEESASMTTRFSLRDVRVPAGWDLELADIRAHRATETRYGRSTGEVTRRISPVLRLFVPQNAELGESTVRGQLVARGGGSQPVEFSVRVRAPEVR